jgi:hypothetical protein
MFFYIGLALVAIMVVGITVAACMKKTRVVRIDSGKSNAYREEMLKRRKRILSYPIKRMTQEEVDRLPRDVEVDFFRTCPIGSLFLCSSKTPELEDLVVVGQVVKGDDMFADQWGGGLCVPDRGVNRYRLEIIAA